MDWPEAGSDHPAHAKLAVGLAADARIELESARTRLLAVNDVSKIDLATMPETGSLPAKNKSRLAEMGAGTPFVRLVFGVRLEGKIAVRD
jgi:hypothetical protein